MMIRVERDGPVTTILLSRPETRNAMDPASADALVTAFLAFDDDPDAFAAVLCGEGGAFCAGFGLKYASWLEGSRPLAHLGFPHDEGPAPRGPMGPTGSSCLSP